MGFYLHIYGRENFKPVEDSGDASLGKRKQIVLLVWSEGTKPSLHLHLSSERLRPLQSGKLQFQRRTRRKLRVADDLLLRSLRLHHVSPWFTLHFGRAQFWHFWTAESFISSSLDRLMRSGVVGSFIYHLFHDFTQSELNPAFSLILAHHGQFQMSRQSPVYLSW